MKKSCKMVVMYQSAGMDTAGSSGFDCKHGAKSRTEYGSCSKWRCAGKRRGRRCSEKKVALTFDDGPDPDYTEMLLDGLKKRNVKATFFCWESRQKHIPIS